MAKFNITSKGRKFSNFDGFQAGCLGVFLIFSIMAMLIMLGAI
ncbi:hypothetical protein [uncultured Methanobrevibacter sp.]|nr:hypothetical protein [uncultured Methanobrevibacter sp.]